MITFYVLYCQLQAEVKLLEELKLKNIQNVTEAIRNEIAVLWDKCFYSTDQRQAFVPYYDGGLSFFWITPLTVFCNEIKV